MHTLEDASCSTYRSIAHPHRRSCFSKEQFGTTTLLLSQDKGKKKSDDNNSYSLYSLPGLLAWTTDIRGGGKKNGKHDDKHLKTNDPTPITNVSDCLIELNDLLIELLGKEVDAIASLLDRYSTYKVSEAKTEKRNCFTRIMEDEIAEIRSQIRKLTNAAFTSVDDYASKVLSNLYKGYAEFLDGQREVANGSKYCRCESFLREQANIFQDMEDYLEGGNGGLGEAVLCSVLVGFYKERASTLSSQAFEYLRFNGYYEGRVYEGYGCELYDQAELLVEKQSKFALDSSI